MLFYQNRGNDQKTLKGNKTYSNMTNGLRLKIIFGTATILGASLLALGIYLINSQERQLIDNLREHGNRIASLAARSSAEYIQRFSFFLMEDQAISIEQSPNIAFCEIYDTEGASLLQSGNIISKDHEGKRKAQYGKNILVVSQPILAGGTNLGRVEIGLRLDSIEKAIKDKKIQLVVLFTGFSLCLIMIVSFFFQKVLIKPVLNLAEGTQSVAQRDFVTINVGDREDEIGLLARNFNQMSRTLQGLYVDLEGKVRERTKALEQANRDLQVAVRQAQDMAHKAAEGTQAKSQFLAAMSHEIRTPMNAVLGMGEVLSESDLDEEQRRYVEILLESGSTLLNLIDDILDLTKIEAGEIVIENTEFDLAEVVDKSFKVMAYTGHQKGLDLDYMISPEVPGILSGDPRCLQQILINLLGNAIKFTGSGFVCLEVRMDSGNGSAESDSAMVRFCMRDSGVGVEPEKLEKVFDKFTQGDASTTRKYGGTGLGLSICHSLCEHLGGRIWMESEVGKGCSVNFILPFAIPKATCQTRSILAGKHFLLIDEREFARAAFASRLEEAGARVDLVAGHEAARSAIQSAIDSGDPYDAVAVNVPVREGNTESLSAKLIQSGIAPDEVIWLMADGAGQALSTPSGFVVTKPVCLSEFEGAIISMLPSKERKRATRDKGMVGDGKELSILLVEDSETNSMLLELYLKDSGHRLHIAENGEKGLEIFKSEPMDVVFMDIEMPVMDGLECTRLIREWETARGWSPVHIVALTAHAISDIRKRVQAYGCNACLTKPISKKIFRQTVNEIADAKLAM